MNYHEEEHNIVIESITDALFEILKKKPFSEITITELIKKAGVARSTYYRNFETKEDIICQFIRDVFKEFYNTYPTRPLDQRFTPDHIANVLNFLEKYNERIQILCKSNIDSYFLVCLNGYLMELYGNPPISSPTALMIYANAGIEYNLIFKWYISQETTDPKLLIKHFSDMNISITPSVQ